MIIGSVSIRVRSFGHNALEFTVLGRIENPIIHGHIQIGWIRGLRRGMLRLRTERHGCVIVDGHRMAEPDRNGQLILPHDELGRQVHPGTVCIITPPPRKSASLV